MIGATIRNVGLPLQINDSPQADALPSRADVGIQFTPRMPAYPNLGVHVDADVVTRLTGVGGPGVRVGGELSWARMYHARAGYVINNGPSGSSGPTIGAGASVARWRLDFAQFLSDLGTGAGEQADLPLAQVCVLMRAVVVRVVALITMDAVAAASAQSLDGTRAGVVAQRMDDSLVSPPRNAPNFAARLPARRSLRGYAPLASAVVPGSGQFILGNDRFVAYVAVEALAWWKYSKDVGERAARRTVQGFGASRRACPFLGGAS